MSSEAHRHDRGKEPDRLERVTVRMHPNLISDIEQLVDDGHYETRSQAIREILRSGTSRQLCEQHRGDEQS